jgi:hypothetical protein
VCNNMLEFKMCHYTETRVAEYCLRNICIKHEKCLKLLLALNFGRKASTDVAFLTCRERYMILTCIHFLQFILFPCILSIVHYHEFLYLN